MFFLDISINLTDFMLGLLYMILLAILLFYYSYKGMANCFLMGGRDRLAMDFEI